MAGRGTLDKKMTGLQAQPTVQAKMQAKDAEVWVKKWVDYSSKYGLGYYLSN